MADFEERLKRRFIDSVEQKQLDCEVGGIPDDKQLDVEDGYMGIERDEMRSIFEPVVQDIFRFVMAQIETAASSGNPISVSFSRIAISA